MLNLKEIAEVERLEEQLESAKRSNYNKNKYYYQKNKIADLGINTPDSLRGLQIQLGWCKMAVDSIAERINWRGYYNPEVSDEELNGATDWLNSIYKDNFFEGEQQLAQKDALTTGTGFISVGAGDVENGEPEILWIAENSSTITLKYNKRKREVQSAFKIIAAKEKENDEAILWLPDATIELAKNRAGDWVEVDRDEHEAGVVGVVPIFNNSDSKFVFGRSEITRSLRDLQASAMRTLVNAEINREYYASPQRFLIGADPADIELIDENGSKAIKTSAGSMIYLPYNNSDSISPDIKEFSANSPSAVMEMVEPTARLAAREMGVPPSYMGFDSVNPTSADAINAAENALTKKADARIVQLKRTYKRLANVSMAYAGRDIPENWKLIDTIFERTETLTPSAAADRASKLNAIGVYDRALPDYQYRELGMSDAEIVELKSYLRTTATTNIIDRLNEEVDEVEGDEVNGS